MVLKGGIRGVAFATALSQTLALFLSLLYVKQKYKLKLSSITKMKFAFKTFNKAIKFGMPLAMQYVLLSVGVLILVSIVSPMGASVMAGFTIVGRLELFTAMPFLDFSGALTNFTAQNFGAKEFERIKLGLKKSLLLTVLFAVIVSTLVIVFQYAISRVFSQDNNVIVITTKYIHIVYPFLILYSIMVILHGALNGIGKTFVPLICTLISFIIIRIPLSFFLREHYGVEGLIWAVVIGWSGGLLYTLWMATYLFNTNKLAIVEVR